jgi:hypothetical protein
MVVLSVFWAVDSRSKSKCGEKVYFMMPNYADGSL